MFFCSLPRLFSSGFLMFISILHFLQILTHYVQHNYLLVFLIQQDQYSEFVLGIVSFHY